MQMHKHTPRTCARGKHAHSHAANMHTHAVNTHAHAVNMHTHAHTHAQDAHMHPLMHMHMHRHKHPSTLDVISLQHTQNIITQCKKA